MLFKRLYSVVGRGVLKGMVSGVRIIPGRIDFFRPLACPPPVIHNTIYELKKYKKLLFKKTKKSFAIIVYVPIYRRQPFAYRNIVQNAFQMER